jgi:hypothetical protein
VLLLGVGAAACLAFIFLTFFSLIFYFGVGILTFLLENDFLTCKIRPFSQFDAVNSLEKEKQAWVTGLWCFLGL